jgi:hypothetical protein
MNPVHTTPSYFSNIRSTFIVLKNKRRLMSAPRCLPTFPPQIFVKRLVRSPCSLCVSVSLLFVARRRALCVSLCVPHHFCPFYGVRLVSKESRRLVLHSTSCNVIPHPRLDLPSDIFPSDFPTKILDRHVSIKLCTVMAFGYTSRRMLKFLWRTS